MPVVNNVTRFLDAKKITYTAYETLSEKLGAVETARLLNLPAEQVFKTIVVVRSKPGKPILALIPGTGQADLKMIASAVDEKKVSLPTEKEAEALTGLQAGGISPLALINKGFQVLIDSSAQKFSTINVSGGQRGLSIAISPADLAMLTRARFAPVASALEADESG